MDKIIAQGLKFRGCHGVLPEEKLEPQDFIVDLYLYLNLREAGISDELKNTVNYAEVYQQVQKIVEGKSRNLLESLAEDIAAVLLEKFSLQAVEITVKKPHAPIDGEFDFFAVKIRREA